MKSHSYKTRQFIPVGLIVEFRLIHKTNLKCCEMKRLEQTNILYDVLSSASYRSFLLLTV